MSRSITTVCLVVLLALPATRSAAADWYAAPGAPPVAEGTREDPLELATLLGPTSPARAGDTIYLRGGTYAGPLYSRLAGEENEPITVRPAPGERATIDGASGDATTLVIGGKWTVWRDLEVTCSATGRQSRETTEGGRYGAVHRPEGIVLRGSDLLIAGCIVHDCRDGIVCWSDSRNVEISGCVIYNNGWLDPVTGHGDGIRIHSDKGVKRVLDNVVFNQFGCGVYVFSRFERVHSLDMAGNVSFNNGSLRRDGLRAANFYLAPGPKPSEGVTFRENHAWHSLLTATTCQLGAGQSAGDLVCTDNTFGGITRVMGWRRLTMNGNTFVSDGTAVELHWPRVMSALQYDWKTNRYWHGSTDWSPMALYRPSSGGGLTFAGWQRQTGYDAASSFTAGRPTELRVVVRKDARTRNRGLIVVYNWPLQDEVEVSLRGVVDEGAAYRILNAQDPFGEPVARGTFDGKPIRLPTSGRRGPAAVGGSPKPPGLTGPLFNVFLIREDAAALPPDS